MDRISLSLLNVISATPVGIKKFWLSLKLDVGLDPGFGCAPELLASVINDGVIHSVIGWVGQLAFEDG